MEKVLEKKLNGSPKKVRGLIRRRLGELERQYSRKSDEFNISYAWNGSGDRVMIKSDYISGEIRLSPKRLTVYANVPFFMLPFKKKCVEVLKREVEGLFL